MTVDKAASGGFPPQGEGLSGLVHGYVPSRVGDASIDPMKTHWQALRQQLGDVLQHWALRLRSSDGGDGPADDHPNNVAPVDENPDSNLAAGLPLEALTLMGLQQEDSSGGLTPAAQATLCPGLREPLSVEDAVLTRQMNLLKREAADALAALGAAHALVSSARLAQVQQLRPRVEAGEVPGEELMALAADYQGWQNDQVRVFDALALVLRMRVPQGMALDQVDPDLQRQARSHLQSLSVEYQRQLLQAQFQRLS